MADDSTNLTVPVVCPDCDTTTRVAVDSVLTAVETHNDNLHNGREVAHVDPDIADRIADLAAADLGLTDD